MQISKKRQFILFSLLICLGLLSSGLIVTFSLATGLNLMDAAVIDKSSPFFPLAVALSIGISGLSAGYAISKVGPAAISASVESNKSFITSILMAGMAEAIAIYGLITALLLLVM